jgi:hypothetical protein
MFVLFYLFYLDIALVIDDLHLLSDDSRDLVREPMI